MVPHRDIVAFVRARGLTWLRRWLDRRSPLASATVGGNGPCRYSSTGRFRRAFDATGFRALPLAFDAAFLTPFALAG